MNKEQIEAYQDGGYDALKQLLEFIKKPSYETAEDCIVLVENIIKELDSVSTRPLGLK